MLQFRHKWVYAPVEPEQTKHSKDSSSSCQEKEPKGVNFEEETNG